MVPPSADDGSAYTVYEWHNPDAPDGQPRSGVARFRWPETLCDRDAEGRALVACVGDAKSPTSDSHAAASRSVTSAFEES